uniref:Uncharacterized protein n=1 Tax=Caenorhabditis japonica TaxID=281687 RepID=A0A8R1IX73_CAEJA
MIHKIFILVVFGALLVTLAESNPTTAAPVTKDNLEVEIPANEVKPTPTEQPSEDSSPKSGSFDINYFLVTAAVVALAAR